MLSESASSSDDLQDHVENHPTNSKIQGLYHMDNAADNYVSGHEALNPHNMNTDCFASTHENTSNMVNHLNDLPMKEFDLTDSDPDYLPSADDQSEITESDGEEYGSKDKMGPRRSSCAS